MALKSTSISKNGSKGHHGFVLTVYEDSINESSNTSSISFKLELYNLTNGGWDWNGWNTAIMAYVNINGKNYSNSIPAYGGSGYLTVCSGSGISVAHNDSSGEASITFSFEITENSYAAAASYTCGTAKNSGSMTLTTIPRYTTASVSIANDYQERTLNFSYTIGHECSSVKYYVNNTAYTASGLTAGTHKISLTKDTTPSIQAGTQYTIYVKATRKSSGKVTDSASQTITTYSYPYVKSISPTSFYIGQTAKLTADIYNPLKRSVTLHMKNNSTGTEIAQVSTSKEGNVDITPSTNNLYDTIGTNKSAAMAVYCKYGSTNTSSSKTGTYYTVESLARPNFSSGAVTWSDATTYASGFTKDASILIQNKGKLKIKLTTGATAARAAGTITYKATCGGQTINSLALNTDATFANTFDIASTAELVITATDQRGYSTSMAAKTINFYPYTPPTISASAHRQNNYENKCFYTAAAGSSPCGGNNKITNFYFKYTLSGSEKTQSIGSGSTSVSKTETEITNALPNANAYDLMFYAVDTLGATSSFRVTIPKGVPIFFIDTKNLAAGVNCFPSAKGFEVDGEIKGSSLNVTGNATISGQLNANFAIAKSATLGSTGSETTYGTFARMLKSNASGMGEVTVLLTGLGDFGGNIPGSALVTMSNRGSVATMKVNWIRPNNGGTVKFGYYSDNTYFYFGVHTSNYSYTRNVLTLSNAGGHTVYNGGSTSTKPSNWVEVTAENPAYPKGSIYMSIENVSPASLFGGSWNPINNVFLLAQGSSYSAGGSGGSAAVSLSVEQLPKHSHTIPALSGSTGNGGGHDHRISGDHDAGKGSYGWSVHDQTSGAQAYVGYTNWAGEHSHSVTTNQSTTWETGNGNTHNNMPPYVVVYMWKRVS